MEYDVLELEGVTYCRKPGTFILHCEDGPAVVDGDYKAWYWNGNQHRDDGPAVVSAKFQSWYQYGKLHREDGPAVEYTNGDKFWYLDDQNFSEEEFNERVKYHIVEDAGTTIYFKKGTKMFHREDGPAVKYNTGYEAWYVEGKRHREDGPAVTYNTGYEAWYVEGKRHREDGPALTYATGEEFYYLNHERLTKEEFDERVG